jgi:hypothetical protein
MMLRTPMSRMLCSTDSGVMAASAREGRYSTTAIRPIWKIVKDALAKSRAKRLKRSSRYS